MEADGSACEQVAAVVNIVLKRRQPQERTPY
jgi:hypothetical protein